MTVLDTSGAVDVLLGSGAAGAVVSLLEREGSAAAPDILVFEALSVLRRMALRRDASDARLQAAVDDLQDLPIELYPALPLRRRVWELRRNVTAGDALFLVLAEDLGEPLATKDEGLAKAAERRGTVPVVRLG